MRRRVLLIIFLCLAAGAFAMAQVFHLVLPSDTATTPQKFMASGHEPPASVEHSVAAAASDAPPSSSDGKSASRVEGPPGPDRGGAVAGKAEDVSKSDAVKLDLAEVSTSGATSVFAGRAAPGASVTVFENGVAVATAKANDNGDWSLATDHKFAGPDPKFSLRAGAFPTQDQAEAQSPSEPQAKAQSEALADARSAHNTTPAGDAPSAQVPAGAAAAKPTSPSVALLKNFESVVASAREDAKAHGQTDNPSAPAQSTPPAAPAVAAPSTSSSSSSTSSAVSVLSPSPSSDAGSQRSPPASIPVPMTFVFDEATLTHDGEKTAKLLLDYVLLKKFKSIALTGHADERGTAEYNMELSSKRLDAIATYLRDGGYHGEMKLVPEGATQPFMGIDRTKYSRDDLLQLDRRVELRNAM